MSAEVVDRLAAVTSAVLRVGGVPSQQGDRARQWLNGTSGAVERIRARIRELGRAAAPLVVVQGEPGVGKRRVAAGLHAAGPHAATPVWLVEAGLDAIALPDAPATVVVANLDHAGPAAIAGLVAAVHAPGERQLILLARTPLGSLRARSLAHGQLLGAAARTAILVPPLRARRLDVAALARALADEAAVRYDRPARGLSPGAVARLEAHAFPGNVRELRALIEVATLQATGDWITAEAFSGLPTEGIASAEPGELTVRLPGTSLREIELEVLRMALRITRGRVVRTAELLGITRHALRRKLEKHQLGDLRARSADGDADGDGDNDGDGDGDGDILVPRLREDSDASFA